jgi:ribosomal protein L37E
MNTTEPQTEPLIGQSSSNVGLGVLATLICRLPFAGKSKSGGSKKTACCPRCGASSRSYGYRPGSRWKNCAACGYDRLKQGQFEAARWREKRGHSNTAAQIIRALSYYNKVYGAPNA